MPDRTNCVDRMDCEPARNCIFQADTLDPVCWPTDVAERMAKCAACTQTALELRQIEDDWRHLPVPADAIQAQTAFLQKLPAMRTVNRTHRAAPSALGMVAATSQVVLDALSWMMPRPIRVASAVIVGNFANNVGNLIGTRE